MIRLKDSGKLASIVGCASVTYLKRENTDWILIGFSWCESLTVALGAYVITDSLLFGTDGWIFCWKNSLALIKVIVQWAKEWKREHTQISIVRKSLTALYWYIDDIKLLCYNEPNVRFIYLD